MPIKPKEVRGRNKMLKSMLMKMWTIAKMNQ